MIRTFSFGYGLWLVKIGIFLAKNRCCWSSELRFPSLRLVEAVSASCATYIRILFMMPRNGIDQRFPYLPLHRMTGSSLLRLVEFTKTFFPTYGVICVYIDDCSGVSGGWGSI